MRKKIKVLSIIFITLALIAIINFLPTFNLKTNKMISKETEAFIIYYETQDEEAVQDIADILEKTYKKINSEMKFNRTEKTKIYVYPDQKTFQTKKYGNICRIIGPKWYIGDNVKDKVTIVSPLNPGPAHDYDSIVQAVVHEYVHTVVYHINKKTPK